MKDRIQEYLSQIEKDKGIKILWACETGSRAWGFASTDSDFDVRMIYVHKMDWYLELTHSKDSLEMMYDNNDIDITGWELKKALQLLMKSNASMLERIQSSIVYRSDEKFIEELRKLAHTFYSKVATMHHYLSMAKKFQNDLHTQKEFRLKKFFYLLRSTLVCKWIIEKQIMPPIDFNLIYTDLNLKPNLIERIDELIELKSTITESYLHTGEYELFELIGRIIGEAEAIKDSLPHSSGDLGHLSSFFIKYVKKYDH